MAAPTPTPANPSSVIGVSTTRIGSELVEQPAADLVGALIDPDLLSHEEDAVVPLHLLAESLIQGVAYQSRHDCHDRDRCSRPRKRRYTAPRGRDPAA